MCSPTQKLHINNYNIMQTNWLAGQFKTETYTKEKYWWNAVLVQDLTVKGNFVPWERGVKVEKRWGLVVEDDMHYVIECDLVIAVETWENGIATLLCKGQTDRSHCLKWWPMRLFQTSVWRLIDQCSLAVSYSHMPY